MAPRAEPRRAPLAGQLLPLLLLLWVLVFGRAPGNRCQSRANDPPDEAAMLADERRELTAEQLGAILSGFGAHLRSIMGDRVEQLLSELRPASEAAAAAEAAQADGRPGNGAHLPVNGAELARLRNVNQQMSDEAQAHINLAAQVNRGQLTQSYWGAAARPFLEQVSGRLRSASDVISSQMSYLSSLAPKIRGRLEKIPDQLRRLAYWPSFLEFKIKFNKAYKSLREELYRQMVFVCSQAVVGVQNLRFFLGKASYLQRPTEYADITAKEYRAALSNELAEGSAGWASGAEPVLGASARARLERLAASGRNLFGQQVVPPAHNQSEGHRRRRKKRALAPEAPAPDAAAAATAATAAPENELDADDDEHQFELDLDMALDLDPEMDDEERAQLSWLRRLADDNLAEPATRRPNDEAQLVDEFADEFEGGPRAAAELDELEKIVDEALAGAHSAEALPFVSIDLRNTGCIIKPENQHLCGNCYAQMVVAAASYYNCMAAKASQATASAGAGEEVAGWQRYNARFTSDCGKYLSAEGEPLLLRGCAGGRVSLAIEFTSLTGVHLFTDYEIARASSLRDYQSDDCAFDRPASLENWADTQVPYYRQSRFVYLQPEEIGLHLRVVGPVFVTLRTWNNFKTQGAGIYDQFDDSDEPVIHSMLIVGHSRDPRGRDYYIIWNSHGTAWGEDGFVRIYKESLLYFRTFIGGLIDTNLLAE